MYYYKMMGGKELTNLDAVEDVALVSAELEDLRKKVNAESWTSNMEKLIAGWGEKADGLRFMHAHTGGLWKKFGNNLAISGILVTSIASSVSLLATSVEDVQIKNAILFSVGGVGMISTLIQSFKKFYNAEEKAAEHASVSKQFGCFYRYIRLQMSMSREDRDSADVVSAYALKEYERLLLKAPTISGKSIKQFKVIFSNGEQAIANIADDKLVIKVIEEEK
jgi:hypothetical protein